MDSGALGSLGEYDRGDGGVLCKGVFIFLSRLFRCAEVPWALVFVMTPMWTGAYDWLGRFIGFLSPKPRRSNGEFFGPPALRAIL
jgi:hypothetical protein